MSLSSTCVWEVRNTGSDSNGGFFNPAASGVDYSQQDSPQLSLSDVSSNGTTTLTSAAGGFTAAMVGNGLNIGGTIYEIVSRSSTNTIVVDRAVASGSLQSARVGGALASPGKCTGAIVNGNYVWLKGAFAVTTTSVNTSGGPIDLNVRTVAGLGNSSTNGQMQLRGYGTTRGDTGTASLTASGIAPSSTLPLIKTYQYTSVFNLIADGASITNVRGFDSASTAFWNYVRFCIARNCTAYGIIGWTEVEGCGLVNNSLNSGLDSCSTIFDCWGYGQNGGECLIHARTGVVDNCWAWNCANVNQALGMDSGGRIWNCRVANCLRGIGGGGNPRPARLRNNIVWGSTQWNYFIGSGSLLNSCTTGGNGSADSSGYSYISLSSTPFVDAANGDLRLKPASVSALKALGFPVRSDWEQLSNGFSPIGSSLISRTARLSC